MKKDTILSNRLGYLSASPRISTNPDAENSGPRAHILSFIEACESLRYKVKPFIVGDRVPQKWVTKGSQRAISGNIVRSLAVDLTRLFLGYVNESRAWRELSGQVDWVYERYASFSSLGRTFKQHGIPWVVETNAPLFYEAKTERKSMMLTELARWLELQAYKECDALVCVTEALKELIVNESGIQPEKVIVVPNGVDTDLFNPKRYQPKRIFPDFTVGFVGALYVRQGLDLLLKVLHELRLENCALSLVVVGDGFMYEEWKNLAQRLNIASNVTFVGQVPWSEVPSYISGFDVAYTGQTQLPLGKMYHSPLKLYEYLSMAKPVIASAFEDAQQVLQEGKTGFLFEPGNHKDLKRALTQAYQSREQLPAMGQEARKLVLAKHSWVARVSTMIEAIESILNNRQLAR